jgi:glycosyltransferase involved in cell wall biosynthesis
MTASPEPLVSVIVPCYKQAHFLRGAVESVLVQTYPRVEAIVVNDGSPDETAAVAAGFGSRIRYVEQANGGLAAARNTGIRHATGELVNFLDADDYLLPTMLEHVVRAAAAHPEAAVFHTAMRYIDLAGNAFSEEPPRLHGDPFHELLQGNFIPPNCFVLRRSALAEVGTFDPQANPCEDWDLWLRLAERGFRFMAVPEARGVYRRYAGSMSRDPIRMGRAAGMVLTRHASRHGYCPRCLKALKRGLANCRSWYVHAAFPELGALERERERLVWERSLPGRLRHGIKRFCLAVPGLRQLFLAVKGQQA